MRKRKLQSAIYRLEGPKMTPIEQAKRSARLLSQQQYQGYSRWCVDQSISTTFEKGDEVKQTESINIVATTGEVGFLKLTLKDALAVLAVL